MAGRPSKRLHLQRAQGEINILPVMNVMAILVPFLLLFASFIKLTIIDTALPAVSGPGSKYVDDAEASPTPPPMEKKLNLTVAIMKEGFMIAGIGGILDINGENKPDLVEVAPRTIIAKKPDGEYDYDKLKEILIRIKEAFPGQNTIILLPEPSVLYRDIVKLMDVARTYKKTTPDGKETEELLFPAPVLAARLI
ncbi:MAG: hypothetical protein GX444_14915 [Myxococcales bacterium]|nr:hypothetical protein [Myxococcales bacterium]